MFFDTHCHLNFKAFEGKVEAVINSAKKVGVGYFVVPGTDIKTSQKAIEIAEKFDGVYAAVGINPHHLFQKSSPEILPQLNSPASGGLKHPLSENFGSLFPSFLKEVAIFLTNTKVVAVGEVGLDRYYYKKTKYSNYQITKNFIRLQKLFFLEQLKLARKYQKAVIVHNRLAGNDLLNILSNIQYLISNIKIVFHCCEPDDELLIFAKKHKIFIGVDGDVTYDRKKQEFIKKVPLDLLVLEQ